MWGLGGAQSPVGGLERRSGWRRSRNALRMRNPLLVSNSLGGGTRRQLTSKGPWAGAFCRSAWPAVGVVCTSEGGGDAANVGLLDHIAALRGSRQEPDRFLDVRSKRHQRYDLRRAGHRDLAEPGQFRLLGDHPALDQLVAADRQRHPPRDAGDLPEGTVSAIPSRSCFCP